MESRLYLISELSILGLYISISKVTNYQKNRVFRPAFLFGWFVRVKAICGFISFGTKN